MDGQSNFRGPIRFGVFELDPASGKLRKHGTALRLQEQPFQVLLALLERPGEVVSREELQQRLWPDGTFVDYEDGLATAVHKVRTALNDSATTPRFVETLPKRGYRFIASVEGEKAASKPADANGPEAPMAESPGAAGDSDDLPVDRADPQHSSRSHFWPTIAFGLAVIGVLGWFRALQSDGEVSREQPVRRFTIVPELTGSGVFPSVRQSASVALSPDGSMVAYCSSEQPSRVWFHDLGSGQSRPVDGTEFEEFAGPGLLVGVHKVFWSPDSKELGFFTRYSLKKVSLRDGGITTLHARSGDGSEYLNAAWSPDGRRIVFVIGRGGRPDVLEIATSGGEPRPVRPGYSEIWGRNTLFFLPTGNRILAGRVLLDLDSGAVRDLNLDGSRAAWSPTGHIVFDREGSVWALPYSIADLRPNGEEFLVERGFINGGVSNDGTLGSVTAPPDSQTFRLAVFDPAGKRVATVGTPLFAATAPAVSPGGDKIALSASLQPGSLRNIWVFDVTTPGRLRMTNDNKNDYAPVWMTDGSKILFRKSLGGARDGDLFMVDAAGGPPEVLQDNAQLIAEATVDPAGQMVMYQQRELDASQFDLHLLNLQTGESRPWLKSEFSEVHPSFSPDGEYVAYVSDQSGAMQVHVRKFPEGKPEWQVSSEGAVAPRWGADGAQLYWWALSEGYPIVRAKVDFGRTHPIVRREEVLRTGRNAAISLYDVMPDGRIVVIEPVVDDESETVAPVHIRVTQNWHTDSTVAGETSAN